MIKTRITELLGVKYPIICGSMRNVSDARLVSAVSEAGGFGFYGGYHTAQQLMEEVRKIKALTDKPFGISINVVLSQDAESLQRVRDEELVPLTNAGVGVIETVGRLPDSFVQVIKASGLKWLHRCARVRDARTAERIGVDAVTIIGYEAAGLVGAEDVTSMIRIPAAVEAVKIPVIAAGGIGDARSFVAALALGAEGVLMGTRFMCTQESMLHPDAKRLILETPENGLAFLMQNPALRERVINTDFAKRVRAMETSGASPKELEHLTSGVLHNRAFIDGEIDEGPMHCGQVTGIIHDVPTCAELIERMVSEARAIGKRLKVCGVFD